MGVTIILEGPRLSAPQTISRDGNERMLLQEDSVAFPLLSMLDLCSYDVFSRDDMDALLEELPRLTPPSAEMAAHLNEIRRLAEIARRMPGATLTFTPFEVSSGDERSG